MERTAAEAAALAAEIAAYVPEHGVCDVCGDELQTHCFNCSAVFCEACEYH